MAAAIIWTAHPQSIEAIAATLPIVFASVISRGLVISQKLPNTMLIRDRLSKGKTRDSGKERSRKHDNEFEKGAMKRRKQVNE